ncbi:beta-lactamase family protein [Nocardioides humilatus]|uniref:Beta-lactamase family protein n=1 Tax=Nocardioides humilatus TaxID=2607660 RepID=A0A5B1LK77_9ACTN|nr:serine hydrolase domain-containing protein [Nocardioides humilatus]KAA1420963.1 beta-lactamase family protein [Nocardioides humilatus]
MVDGTCAPEFAPLRDLLTKNLADGTDAGASVAVIHDGELVVDLWGGEARPGVPWREDTVVMTWSVTKVMAALTVLVLADRGDVDLDSPVADYWPDFATNGKDGVLVRHLLSHTSGVPGWSRPVTVEDLLDLERSSDWLAEESLWYEPGVGSAYQIVDHGHLLDGLVRRAAGRPLADVFRDEVAGPFADDFMIGVPDDQQDRCADLLPPPPSGVDYSKLPPDSFLLRTMANPLLLPEACNSPDWRRGSVGSVGGHGNARGVAQIQAAVSHGGAYAGRSLLSDATIDRVFDVQASGLDQVLMQPVTWGIGYGLPTPSAPAVPDGRTCWWSGWGGSVVVNALDSRTTVAYVPNQMASHLLASPRTDTYLTAAFDCVAAL